MDDLASLLTSSRAHCRAAVDRLFDLAYAELREMAHRRLRRASAITHLDTTALVHECYLRLAKLEGLPSADRAYLMCYAARAMRSIIIDLLRQKGAIRNGGELQLVRLEPHHWEAIPAAAADLLRVDEALEELESVDPRLARVVEMKYFVGLEFNQIGEALGVTARTAQRDWQKARLWLDAALRA
jgi:RNA polymerase sigma factor (TIGR02999 family)